ncbi:universal stress protein [Neotamlana laminarinivorans]|uniref:Universal stress protein n=1 Tax=Neotamlana laminarinivorans TaxID=2883124 RepID=A0A9X1HYZ7_9FLAO|nr:universal stress protein [Tamlana laminarinivorans]MCB4798694.1 universal stress protein [Tamlana laminarinivorans]
MKKIIVPIDFSIYSEYALEAAATMAKQNNGEVLAIHMLELSEAVLTKDGFEQNQEAIFYLKLAEKKFKEFLQKDYLQGVRVTPIVKHFKVFSEISDVAEDHSADLIIMGSHGSSGISEIFVGSNTEKVVRHSNIPVLVLKDDIKIEGFKKVLFATDFSSESVEVYKKALAKFEALNVEVNLLYVNTPSRFLTSKEMREKVANFLTEAEGNTNRMANTSFVSNYSVEAGILNQASEINADLIAVATHGRKGIAHFLEGSISEDVANHAVLPVMTFKI